MIAARRVFRSAATPTLALAALLCVSAPVVARQELVSFATEDGGVVYADVYGAGERGLVLAHGGRFTKESWVEQAPLFAEAGFRVVAIDFRGRGQSGGGTAGNGGSLYDVMAAVNFLRDSGARSVYVVGGSFGGSVAAAAAVAAPGTIDRIVLLASPIDDPEQLGGRKLFILARDDPTFSGTPRLVGIREDFDLAPEPKELVILEGAAHAQFLFDTDQGDRLLAEILRFLGAR